MQLAVSILSQRAVPGSSSVHTIQGPPHCPARTPHIPNRSSVPVSPHPHPHFPAPQFSPRGRGSYDDAGFPVWLVALSGKSSSMLSQQVSEVPSVLRLETIPLRGRAGLCGFSRRRTLGRSAPQPPCTRPRGARADEKVANFSRARPPLTILANQMQNKTVTKQPTVKAGPS